MTFANLLRLWRSPLVRGALRLYAAQVAIYLFPLITLPYLARVLGPSTFGQLAVAQMLGVFLQLYMDYTFGYTGTREVALRARDKSALAEVLYGVLGAKFLLAIPALVVVIGAQHLVDPLSEASWLIWGAYFYALTSSIFNLSWFYRGLERAKEVAISEVLVRALAASAVFALVKDRSDAHLVLVINGIASALVGLAFLVRLGREIQLLVPNFKLSWRFLKDGFGLFPSHLVNIIRLIVNPFILSFFVSSAAIGIFNAAEHLVRISWAALEPMNRVFFPRMVRLLNQDPNLARIFATKVLLVQGFWGAVVSGILVLTAPWLIHIFYGPAYEDASVLLRLMALTLLGDALVNALGSQWAVAIGMERKVSWVRVFMLLTYIFLASFLLSKVGLQGVAWSKLLISWGEAAILACLLWKHGDFPAMLRKVG